MLSNLLLVSNPTCQRSQDNAVRLSALLRQVATMSSPDAIPKALALNQTLPQLPPYGLLNTASIPSFLSKLNPKFMPIVPFSAFR